MVNLNQNVDISALPRISVAPIMDGITFYK